MTIDTKRLKTDAAYWDELAIPSKANWAGVKNESLVGWSEYIMGNEGILNVEMIPRPTKPAAPEWDGLSAPAPGELARTSGGKCQVLGWDAQREKVAVQWHDGELGVVSFGALKPLRTKEQRQRDELAHLLCPALRQLRHNSSDGFVPAFDYEETLAILSRYNLEPKP